jgi:hypothetical protein
MTSFLSWLMSPQDYMPLGMCFLWQPELIALHVASDSLIALAYYLIPIALIYFVSASACGITFQIATAVPTESTAVTALMPPSSR